MTEKSIIFTVALCRKKKSVSDIHLVEEEREEVQKETCVVDQCSDTQRKNYRSSKVEEKMGFCVDSIYSGYLTIFMECKGKM